MPAWGLKDVEMTILLPLNVKKRINAALLLQMKRGRLQTFPDNYIFEGPKESVRKQIGMAVPPEGAKIIFEAILKTFAGIPYEYMEANIEE